MFKLLQNWGETTEEIQTQKRNQVKKAVKCTKYYCRKKSNEKYLTLYRNTCVLR